jgi:hypothetical protein
MKSEPSVENLCSVVHTFPGVCFSYGHAEFLCNFYHFLQIVVIFLAIAGDLALLQDIYIACSTHKGALCSWIKGLERETGHLPPSNVEITNN